MRVRGCRLSGRRVAAFAIALGVSQTACDPVYHVCVRVLDCETEKPIADARIEADSLTDRTNSSGLLCWSEMGAVHPIEVTVDKRGYESRETTTGGDSSDPDAAVCLEPLVTPEDDPGVRTCPMPEDASRFTGKTLYVDDDPACEGQAPCFATLQAAHDAAGNGDTISVLPGTYQGVLLQQTDQRGDLRLTGARGPDETIITGNCVTIYGSRWSQGQFWIDHLSFAGCNGTSTTVGVRAAISVENYSDVDLRIQDNVFSGPFLDGTVVMRSPKEGAQVFVTVTRNRFVGQSGDAAVFTGDVDGDETCLRFESNVVARNERVLSLEVSPAARVELIGNTFANNRYVVLGRGGTTTPAGAVFANNIFFGNELDFDPESELWGKLDLRHNLIGTGIFTGFGDNFAADPLFRDASADDYHLLPQSPAASSADASVFAGPDADGKPRGDEPSLGAYEPDVDAWTGEPGFACGDGVIQSGPVDSRGAYSGFETCEDGNTDDGDGCSSRCQTEPSGTRGQIAAARLDTDPNLCVLRDDGRLSCWGDAGRNAPEGRFTQVALTHRIGCVLDEEGAAHCWRWYVDRFSDDPPDAAEAYAPPGRFEQLAGDTTVCGLSTSGGVTCWDETETRFTLDGEFVRVDTSGVDACALDAAGKAECEGPNQAMPSGPFAQTMPGQGCGLRSNGELACVGGGSSVRPIHGALVMVSDDTFAGCGLRPDGRAVFFYGGVSMPFGDRHFIDVAATHYHCCGLTRDRKVYCLDNPYGLPQE